MSLVRHAADPSAQVRAAFERVQRERMEGLPLLNAALRVQPVGFRSWQGHWLGVVVTPWCMSLLLVPGAEGDWVPVRGLQRRFVAFPVGPLALLHGEEEGLGEFQTCALFSPMHPFASQADAVATAMASMDHLLARPAAAAAPATPDAGRRRFLGLRQSGTLDLTQAPRRGAAR